MKFSELLGDEPERDLPEPEGEPISVFAPVPTVPPPDTPSATLPDPPSATLPDPPFAPFPAPRQAEAAPLPAPVSPLPPPATAPPPVGGRSGLAEVNIRQEPAAPSPVADPGPDTPPHLSGLSEVVDDLLPSARRRAKK